MTRALVLIDLMPRIIALPVAPHSGEEVLERCLRLASAFRDGGSPVAAVRVDRPNVDAQPPGSGFADGVVRPGDITVVKRTIGAFQGTDLHERLRERGVTTLVFAGLVTNMGVESTARAANDLGYELEFVSDAMSGLTAEEHDFAVTRILPRFGTVRSTADHLAAARPGG
ncbi:nicotinamidase-related amidase [Stackebrandtia albiflava]|uniref:Nicotinamidase-related amidase n=1 Tax=Stackebrandtia albiflava TaxID=406432 RepID=A0A562UQU4_9ACTN|nr:isochorismatase family protein [Stackebrandtia albiflava]TWJ07977.1 nicotinamidase-related amidase [Stackebrandtia albiflava]